MIDTPTKRTSEVPRAFYRDDEPPPPPPDDPHWHEWWRHDEDGPLSRWIIYGLPALLMAVAILHAAVILVLLKPPGT